MSLPRQRITLITLGVSDLERACRFYADWGWKPHPQSQAGVSFYQLQGAVLALFDLAELAADQGRPDAILGTGAMALAQNCGNIAEAEEVFVAALSAGALCLKWPAPVAWGGHSGYFADPDGHVWEIAVNPFWPLDAEGSLTLPLPETVVG